MHATGPNQVWDWDISKLKGPQAWQFFHLYTVIDLISRKVVGWMIAPKECGELAKKLIQTICRREKVDSTKLTIHSDCGSAMTSMTLSLLSTNLGVIKSLSRPRVSNDNAFIESLFKTLKYRKIYPSRFQTIEAAQKYLTKFFDWYNFDHYHTGLGLRTPHVVHAGLVSKMNEQRRKAIPFDIAL